jgi:outer membrane protein TolC
VTDSDAERVRQDLTLAVTQAYFRILEARKIRGVVEESIAAVEEQLRIAQDFFEQGIVAKTDVLVAGVQLARRQQDLILAQNNIELATATLNRLMGLSVARPTQVVDVLEVQTWSGPLDLLVRSALEQRPDLEALQNQVEIARARYSSLRSSFFPRLFAFGNYDRTTDDSQLNQSWFSTGIGVQITLFDVSTYARIRQQAKLVSDAADVRDDRADDITLEVQRDYLNVGAAARRLPVARQGIEQAEENLRVIRDRYREGLVSSADVLTEEERLAQARSDYTTALYDYHQAYAQLVHTVGAQPLAAIPAIPAQEGNP